MEAVMFTSTHRKSGPLLSPELPPDKATNALKLNSTIELLRLRGKKVDNGNEFNLIEAELQRRQRWEYAALIAGVLILISVFMYF